jgi:hypothetical protein
LGGCKSREHKSEDGYFTVSPFWTNGSQSKLQQKKWKAVDVSKTDLTTIVKKMAENLDDLRYGSTSVMLRVHDNRLVDISYTVTHSTRERIMPQGKNNGDEEK